MMKVFNLKDTTQKPKKNELKVIDGVVIFIQEICNI